MGESGRTRSRGGVIHAAVSIAVLAVALASGIACKKTCHGVLLSCDDRCVDPTTSSDHCGACGHACASTSNCVGGKCTVRSCSSDTADCDGDDSNGCETKLGTNENCSACNAKCTGTCDGICYRALVHDGINAITLSGIEANDHGLVLFAYESGHTGRFYFLADGAREPVFLAEAQVGSDRFAVTSTDVYFPATVYVDGTFQSGIFRISVAGPTKPVRVGGSVVARNPVATSGHVVYADRLDTQGVLMALPVAGGAPRKIAALEVVDLASDGTNVVAATSTNVVRIEPATGTVTVLADGAAENVWIIDGGVYLRHENKILQVPASGTTPLVKLTVPAESSGPVGLEPRGLVWYKGGKSKPGPLTDTITILEAGKVVRTSWDGTEQVLQAPGITCAAYRRGSLYVGSVANLWEDKFR